MLRGDVGCGFLVEFAVIKFRHELLLLLQCKWQFVNYCAVDFTVKM